MEDNITIDLQEVGCGDIDMVQDRNRCGHLWMR